MSDEENSSISTGKKSRVHFRHLEITSGLDRSDSDDENDGSAVARRPRPAARGRGVGRRGRRRQTLRQNRHNQPEESDESDEWTEDWKSFDRREFTSRSGLTRVLGGSMEALS